MAKGLVITKGPRGIDNKGACGGRCVPTVVDPTILVFEESSGKMATGVPTPGPHNHVNGLRTDNIPDQIHCIEQFWRDSTPQNEL